MQTLETRLFGYEEVHQVLLGKCQGTTQITLFADGQPCVKPLVIFRGKENAFLFMKM